MTTVNSRQVNLRRPSSPETYPLDEYVRDTEVVPIDVFDSLEEAKSFLKEHRGGTVSFPRKSRFNDYKYVVHMTGTPDPLGTVTMNVVTYSDHHPLSDADTRPVDGTEWLRGDVIYNTDCNKRFAPTSWVCVEQGMPGVWMARGYVSSSYGDVQIFDSLPDANEYRMGQLALHRVSNELSELCYCAEVADNRYEWKSILAYETAYQPDEEDLYDKFLAYGLPLSVMEEFSKADGPDRDRMYDFKDRLVTSEDLVEYDRLQYMKAPSLTDGSDYLQDREIGPTDDLDSKVEGVWYCPYDFSTYGEDGTRPNGYPPTDHPVLLECRKMKRVANDVSETMVLQRAMDAMTGDSYSRIAKLGDDGTMVRGLSSLGDESLYEWRQNGNATPIADLTDLLSILERGI